MNASKSFLFSRRLLKLGLRSLRVFVFAGLGLWSTMAVYYSNLPASWLRALAAAIYLFVLVGVLIRVRPWWLARLALLAFFGMVVLWFLLTPPSNDRDWQPDVALLPFADVNGQQVTIHNIRNCDYRSETNYTVSHHDKTFDLTKLESVDFYVVYWGSPMIAHTMMSFGSLDETLPFEQLKARSLINERARAADNDPAFSQRIRETLPGIAGSDTRAKPSARFRAKLPPSA
jgi:hypothetical protein